MGLVLLPGMWWHRLLVGLAGRLRHPRAAVHLREHQRAVGLHYHGLGGDPERAVVADAGMKRAPAGGLRGARDLLAWFDRDQIHLPQCINRFPTPELNRELYFWLAAFFALERDLDGESGLLPGLCHLFRGVAVSARVLERFPALATRYERLCAAELAQRRDTLPTLGDDPAHPAHRLEAGIRYALGAAKPPADAWLLASIEAARRGADPVPPPRWRRSSVPFLPVFLWGCPPRPDAFGLRPRWPKRQVRRRAHGTARSLARPRFDSERSNDAGSRGPRVHGHVYAEWDCRRHSYRARWCWVVERVPLAPDTVTFEPQSGAVARRVRRQFEALREVRTWVRGRESGDELDLEAFVDAVADRRGRGVPRHRLYRQRENRRRDLTVAVLLDASRSTAAWVGEHRVIEVARQSMAILAQALAAAGDEFALYGFSSDSRLRVRCYRVKGYEERYDERSRRRLGALGPGDYTRMGAVVRHAGRGLLDRARAQKLMLVVTDGRPHDPVDGYVGRYAIEDTRRALQEQRARGVRCFGLTIDTRGRAWLPALFGPGHYAVLSRPDALPSVLPRLYARITGLAG